jgi:hypothetical protein
MNQGRVALELPSSQLVSRASEIEQLYLGGPETTGEQLELTNL